MESLIARYTVYLERVLTPRRLRHSQGVMQVMDELAEVYHLDHETAQVTGLLHDAAKDLPPEEQARMVKEGQVRLNHPCEQDYNLYLHGPVGGYYVEKYLGVADPRIIEAIGLHCWTEVEGQAVSPLAWCLRFADILEPNRVWDGLARPMREGMPRLREAVYAGRMVEGAAIQADMIIRFFEACDQPRHPNFYRARDRGSEGI